MTLKYLHEGPCVVARRCRALVFLALSATYYPASWHPATYYPASCHPATYHPATYHQCTQLRIIQLPSSVSLSYPATYYPADQLRISQLVSYASPSYPAAYLSPRYISTCNPFKILRKPVWLHLASSGEPRGFL